MQIPAIQLARNTSHAPKLLSACRAVRLVATGTPCLSGIAQFLYTHFSSRLGACHGRHSSIWRKFVVRTHFTGHRQPKITSTRSRSALKRLQMSTMWFSQVGRRFHLAKRATRVPLTEWVWYFNKLLHNHTAANSWTCIWCSWRRCLGAHRLRWV